MSRAKRSLARKLAKSRSPAQPGRCGRDIADVIRTSFGSVNAERLDPAVQVAPVDLQQARCGRDVAAATRERLPQDAALGLFAQLAVRERPEAIDPALGCSRRRPEEPGRVFIDDERSRIAQEVEALDEIAQLAHVPRPGVSAQRPLTLRRQPQLALRAAQLRGERARERDYVLGPLPQGRDLDGEDRQPVVQVLAEAPLRDRLAQVAMGGGDDAHVDAHRRSPAEPLHLALLEDAEKLRLQFERQLADLVEEQRPALGLLEAADAARGRAGEGALLRPEQLALEELGGYRGAIHGDEAALAPGPEMEGARDALLAGAGLAKGQHHRVAAAGACDQPAQLGHGGALADQVSRLGQLLAQALALFFQVAQGEGVLQRGEDPFGRGRLLDEIGRAELERLRRLAGRGAAGEHDHGRGQRPGKAREEREPALARKPQVEEYRSGRIAREGLVRLRGRGRGLGAIALVAQQAAEAAQHGGIVVDEEDAPAHGAVPEVKESGSSTTACAPRPSRGSSTSVPPCSCTIFCAMGSPSPEPCGFVVPSERRSCAPSSRARIPAPRSRTRTRALPAWYGAPISTGPSPGRDASRAFLIKLPKARRSWSASPSRRRGSVTHSTGTGEPPE